jgi:hypothetical protein
MLNPRRLLRFALASIFESARKHPGTLQMVYYNMPSTISVIRSLTQPSINQNEQNLSQYGYNDDPNETLLLDEAEHLYNKIVEAFANKCINDVTNDTESSSQILQVPDTQLSLSTDEGCHTSLDASEENLFPTNVLFNNISLRLFTNISSSQYYKRAKEQNGCPAKDE